MQSNSTLWLAAWQPLGPRLRNSHRDFVLLHDAVQNSIGGYQWETFCIPQIAAGHCLVVSVGTLQIEYTQSA